MKALDLKKEGIGGSGAVSQKEILTRTIEKGKVAANEFKNVLRIKEEACSRYVRILRSAARLKRARWTDLKRALEVREGKVSNSMFSDWSTIWSELPEEKRYATYSTTDPLLDHAVRSGFVRWHPINLK